MDLSDKMFLATLATFFTLVVILSHRNSRADTAVPRSIPTGRVNEQADQWEKIGPPNLPLFRSRGSYLPDTAYISDVEAAQVNG